MRDTDADWREIAETEPYYGVIAEDRFLSANLTPDAIAAFYASGESDVTFIVGELRRRWPDFAPAAAIDFGCGLGRLTLAMQPFARDIVGVDVAPAMLRRASERADEVGAMVRFTHRLPSRANWVMSHIVFQHIPPSRGLQLLEALLTVLPPGGFASLQFTLFRPAERLNDMDARWVRFDGQGVTILKEEPSPATGMRMFDYDAGAILARFFDAGLTDPLVLRTDHGGHIGAWFLGRRHE